MNEAEVLQRAFYLARPLGAYVTIEMKNGMQLAGTVERTWQPGTISLGGNIILADQVGYVLDEKRMTY